MYIVYTVQYVHCIYIHSALYVHCIHCTLCTLYIHSAICTLYTVHYVHCIGYIVQACKNYNLYYNSYQELYNIPSILCSRSLSSFSFTRSWIHYIMRDDTKFFFFMIETLRLGPLPPLVLGASCNCKLSKNIFVSKKKGKFCYFLLLYRQVR